MGESGEPEEKNIRDRAFGETIDNFGKAIAPLGTEAGEVAVLVGRKLIRGIENSVYGIGKVAAWMQDEVAKRLAHRPPEKIVEPNPRVAVPATQALIFSMNEEHIRDMFANLLAADMDADKKEKVHPAFVELIKEMTSQEARLLKHLRDHIAEISFEVRAGRAKFSTLATHYSMSFENNTTEQMTVSLSNLERLGLVTVDAAKWPAKDKFDAMETDILKRYEPMKEKLPEEKKDIHVVRRGILMTPLGMSFATICLPTQQG